MTLLEFCRSFFPDEEIFTPQEGGLAVHSRRLLELEYAEIKEKRLSEDQVLPSTILGLVQPGRWQYYDPRCKDSRRNGWDGTQEFLLTEEALQTLEHFHLVIDPEAANVYLEARRPYFRVRGRPVTEEQAFDILRRTNIPPTHDMRMERHPWKDLVYCSGFLDNSWFRCFPQGWVLPDGTVGMNGISGIKYPYLDEIACEIIPVEFAFPYLDLVIAMTDWNEAPDYAWDAWSEDDEVFEQEDYPDFLENIVFGIWLHDNTVELMAPERAREKYAEYNRLYGGPDEEIFKVFYYESRELYPVDLAYLKRMIRSHGLDPEEVLAGYEWGPMGLQRKESFYLSAGRPPAAPNLENC